jgi:CheY-like chemotaxis protein
MNPPPPRPLVLIVDDDPLVRALLEIGLQRHGYATLTAPGGHEAAERLRREAGRVAIALIDVNMPGPDGPATVRLLRAIDPGLRCCLMSGDPLAVRPAELAALSAAGLVLKPFDWPDVLRQLRDCPQPERRRHPRWSDEPLPVEVAPAGAADDEAPAAVVNRSAGGVGLAFDDGAPAGERLRVRAAGRASSGWAEVEVRHRRRRNGGWLLGCQFADESAARQGALP